MESSNPISKESNTLEVGLHPSPKLYGGYGEILQDDISEWVCEAEAEEKRKKKRDDRILLLLCILMFGITYAAALSPIWASPNDKTSEECAKQRVCSKGNGTWNGTFCQLPSTENGARERLNMGDAEEAVRLVRRMVRW